MLAIPGGGTNRSNGANTVCASSANHVILEGLAENELIQAAPAASQLDTSASPLEK